MGSILRFAMRYDPNIELAMLHALLVGCINPLGQGTGYLRNFITGARTFDEARSRKVRIFTATLSWTTGHRILRCSIPILGPMPTD